MSSTHEPPQLLEPSNLLEPLDLNQHGDFADPSACGERGERGPRTQPQFTRGKPLVPRPRQAERRSSMKSILLAAGALACFGAGTLFSHMQIVTPSDVGSPTMATANRSFAPLADIATKSDESISTEGKSANSSANESKPDAASSTAATMPPATTPAEQNGSAPSQRAQGGSVAQPPANNAVAGCAGSCKQQPCSPDDANCLEGGAPSPNEWRDWTADKNVPAARFSGRAENVDQAVNWHRDRVGENRWQEREPDRASNSRRDRAAEDRWQERDWDRASTRRRERSDEYGRDDDRRLRAGRDDFLMGRAERNEGSFMIVPPARYRW